MMLSLFIQQNRVGITGIFQILLISGKTETLILFFFFYMYLLHSLAFSFANLVEIKNAVFIQSILFFCKLI